MQRMPQYEAWRAGSPTERTKIARENLRDNPHIVAYWFHARFQTFKREILYKKFNIVDEWYRYEWQGRGSSHCHGTYWVQGALILKILN
jgi:hypothetical protein